MSDSEMIVVSRGDLAALIARTLQSADSILAETFARAVAERVVGALPTSPDVPALLDALAALVEWGDVGHVSGGRTVFDNARALLADAGRDV